MRYPNIVRAAFVERPNRFVAYVMIDDHMEIAHVKNTGRCKELLLPGAEVWLTAPGTEGRKTKYDLVSVRKRNGLLINIDSQAPNIVVKEWLEKLDYDVIIPEFRYGDSRIDFYLEKAGQRTLMEVKGCTLEVDGIGYFPDAPTERGVKHLRELTAAVEKGFKAILAFVIQMDGITEVRANVQTHPEFGTTLQEAKEAGVDILFLPCHVEPDELVVKDGR